MKPVKIKLQYENTISGRTCRKCNLFDGEGCFLNLDDMGEGPSVLCSIHDKPEGFYHFELREIIK